MFCLLRERCSSVYAAVAAAVNTFFVHSDRARTVAVGYHTVAAEQGEQSPEQGHVEGRKERRLCSLERNEVRTPGSGKASGRYRQMTDQGGKAAVFRPADLPTPRNKEKGILTVKQIMHVFQ